MAGVKNYILNNADARNRKVTVFTGPVMDEHDPVYKGIRLPLVFWKIIAYIKAEARWRRRRMCWSRAS